MQNEPIASGEKKLVIECDCKSEHICVTTNYEIFHAGKGIEPVIKQSYELAFYGYGHVRKRSFLNKLRQCWRLLKTGSPYTDMVILNPEEARKLADFINHNRV